MLIVASCCRAACALKSEDMYGAARGFGSYPYGTYFFCAGPAARAVLSPSLLASSLSTIGPFFLWLPIAAHSFRAHCSVARRALLAAFCTWLVCAPPVRMTRLFMSEFDPSGHIFLIGVQLVPLWAARAAAPLAQSAGGTKKNHSIDVDVLRYATYAEPLLWWVSAGTAVFYHSALDVVAAWALVAALAAVVVACAPAAMQQEPAVIWTSSNKVTPQVVTLVEAPSNSVSSSSARVIALAALVIWMIESGILCGVSGILRRAPWIAAMHALHDVCVALAALRLSSTIS